MLSEKERRESPAGLECQTTIMSDARATILRTRPWVYRGCWPALDEALTRCSRHAQRALYNLTVNAVAVQGGPVPATMKSPAHRDGLYGQLTGWRRDTSWIADIPVALSKKERRESPAGLECPMLTWPQSSARGPAKH